MSLKLIIENDLGELAVFPCPIGITTVGRANDNDVIVTDRNISRHHFTIRFVDNRIVLSDLGSYNGTYVNDTELSEPVEIFVGDVIIAGDNNIFLENDDSIQQGTSAVRKSIEPEYPYLFVKGGNLSGKAFKVDKDGVTIGSHPSSDIYLYNMAVPEFHSEIIYDGRMFFICSMANDKKEFLDLNGMNVESVNLVNGDILKIGNIEILFIAASSDFDFKFNVVYAIDGEIEKLRKELKAQKIKSIREEDGFEITDVTKKTSEGFFSKIKGSFSK